MSSLICGIGCILLGVFFPGIQILRTGEPRVYKGNHCVDEFITLPHIAGVTFDAKVGKFIPTHRIQIKYTNAGVHILPVLERM